MFLQVNFKGNNFDLMGFLIAIFSFSERFFLKEDSSCD